jgi:hypothetical protein
MSALPFLSDAEIDGICEPLKRPAAQRKYLSEALKLTVHQKPNGRPLVARSEFERVIGADRFGTYPASDPHNAPNVLGMMAHLANRKHGQKSQGR